MKLTLPAMDIQITTRDKAKYLEWIQLQNKALASKAGYLSIDITLPKRPRTTGERSQNRAINGYIQQICEYTGNEFNDVKMYCKNRAMKRGYPWMMTSEGEVIYSLQTGDPMPESETKISVEQASMLIEEIVQLASELNFRLKEHEDGTE